VHPLLHQLQDVIQQLTPEQLEQQKRELLDLVEALRPFHPNGDGDKRHQVLSPREREVMALLLEGKRLKEIAVHLDIGVKTVTTHRSRLLRKLGLEDSLGLYRYGIRNGLIGL
jgi:DNA-binding CsgD family transcriptional regulator